MKECFKCNIEKELDEFYVHRKMADGHLNKCKDCTKKDSEDRRAKLEAEDLEWVLKERERQRNKQTKRRKEGRIKDYDNFSRNQKYKEKYPEKYAARIAVGNAIRDGKITKGSCFCGECENVQAHHSDYSKSLDVEWLCVQHHNERHVQERDEEVIRKMTKS